MSEVFIPFNQLQNFPSDTMMYVMGRNMFQTLLGMGTWRMYVYYFFVPLTELGMAQPGVLLRLCQVF